MVNDDLLKVKIDVERETQETFMRRVKVRPFTFPNPPILSHPWKSKSEKWKYLLPLFLKSESHFFCTIDAHQHSIPPSQMIQSESTFFHSISFFLLCAFCTISSSLNVMYSILLSGTLSNQNGSFKTSPFTIMFSNLERDKYKYQFKYQFKCKFKYEFKSRLHKSNNFKYQGHPQPFPSHISNLDPPHLSPKFIIIYLIQFKPCVIFTAKQSMWSFVKTAKSQKNVSSLELMGSEHTNKVLFLSTKIHLKIIVIIIIVIIIIISLNRNHHHHQIQLDWTTASD